MANDKLFSNIISPGVIKVNTSFDKLLFGNAEVNLSDLNKIEKIITDAGINCSVYEDIKSKIRSGNPITRLIIINVIIFLIITVYVPEYIKNKNDYIFQLFLMLQSFTE